jgi:ornithine cyclodeaminase
MPAWRPGKDLGVKLVTVFPRNRERGAASVSALYVLFDGATGHPRALIDGEALTLRRTAAASALASTYLSRKDSATLLIIGTCALASHMARAHCTRRPITKLMLWGRRPERALALAAQLRGEGLPAQAFADLPGVAYADIVMRHHRHRTGRARQAVASRGARRSGRWFHAADARRRR